MDNGCMSLRDKSVTLMRFYGFLHHGHRFFAGAQNDAFRSPSLWRFPFSITSDVLSPNRHSERGQACLVGKTGNGIVRLSEESITLMTPYRLPHHGYKSFAFVQDDVLWSSSSRQQAFVIAPGDTWPSAVILNGGKNALWEKRETERWNGVKNLLCLSLIHISEPTRPY